MLVASSLPPLTDETKRHRPIERHPGRALAASKAALIAKIAWRVGSANGRIASPPSSTASAANETAMFVARPENRRSHPRAVV